MIDLGDIIAGKFGKWANDIIHFIQGMCSYHFPIIVPIFILYQCIDSINWNNKILEFPKENDSIVKDLTCFIWGHLYLILYFG